MRHLKRAFNKLGRKASHRKAMLNNMATSLLKYERIQTTEAKSKEVRRLVERLVTYAKKNTLHARRQVLTKIKDKEVVKKLFEQIAPKYKDRNGGYTRIIKGTFRRGDAASTVLIELV
jgi:large subunit ribosomal protein L17